MFFHNLDQSFNIWLNSRSDLLVLEKLHKLGRITKEAYHLLNNFL